MNIRHFIISLCQILTAVITKLWLKFFVDVNVTDPPRLRPHTRYIIAANHQSRLDPLVICAQFSFSQLWTIMPIRYMTAGAIYYSLLHPILKITGCYPTRKKKDYLYKAVDQSIYYLSQGQSICMFPEGRRTLESESQPRGGIVRIVKTSPVPVEVIAVHIDWSTTRGKRAVRIRFAPAHNTHSANALMKQIYRL